MVLDDLNSRSASASNKYYIKINEDEIANDYPLPVYYKTSLQETDEFIVFDNDYDNYLCLYLSIYDKFCTIYVSCVCHVCCLCLCNASYLW